jgi:RHS repeat-associated protein
MNGAVVWSAKYNSFGEANVEVETITNHLRFPGQYYDEETGLHYNLWRYYDSSLGRYLRTDPIDFEGGINLYLYVLNNPKKYFDPEGRSIIGAILCASYAIYDAYTTIRDVNELTNSMLVCIKQVEKLRKMLQDDTRCPPLTVKEKERIIELILEYQIMGIELAREKVKTMTYGVGKTIVITAICAAIVIVPSL